MFAEDRLVHSFGCHEVDVAGVTHEITVWRVLLFRFRIVDLEGFCSCPHLLRRTGQTDQLWMKGRDILSKHLWRIAFGIDRYEQWYYRACIISESIERLGNNGQCGRTDIRAVREAEEHEQPFLSISFLGHLAPGVVDQLELGLDRCARHLLRSWRVRPLVGTPTIKARKASVAITTPIHAMRRTSASRAERIFALLLDASNSASLFPKLLDFSDDKIDQRLRAEHRQWFSIYEEGRVFFADCLDIRHIPVQCGCDPRKQHVLAGSLYIEPLPPPPLPMPYRDLDCDATPIAVVPQGEPPTRPRTFPEGERLREFSRQRLNHDGTPHILRRHGLHSDTLEEFASPADETPCRSRKRGRKTRQSLPVRRARPAQENSRERGGRPPPPLQPAAQRLSSDYSGTHRRQR